MLYHHVLLRIGPTANREQNVLSADMADAHIKSYVDDGWRIQECQAISTDLYSVTVFYLLVKSTEPVAK